MHCWPRCKIDKNAVAVATNHELVVKKMLLTGSEANTCAVINVSNFNTVSVLLHCKRQEHLLILLCLKVQHWLWFICGNSSFFTNFAIYKSSFWCQHSVFVDLLLAIAFISISLMHCICLDVNGHCAWSFVIQGSNALNRLNKSTDLFKEVGTRKQLFI